MCAEFVWISDGGLWWTFRQSSSACAHLALCTHLFVTSARPSTQNGGGTVRPAYCSELFTHHDTSAKRSSHCCMVAVLIVSEYICKHFSTVWVCALIPNHSPRRCRIEWICIHCERKWQDKTIPMTEVILQILITLLIGINRLSQTFMYIASDSYFDCEKKSWC